MKAISLTGLKTILEASSTMNNEELKGLVAGLETMMDDVEQRREIVAKEGEDAQNWLDLLQLLADSPVISSRLRSTIFTFMIRLSRNSGRCPKCLVIRDVEKQGEHPVGGGGFGDVYKGTINHAGSTQTVCLKVVKIYLTSDVRRSLVDYLREAIVWKQLDHPNILPFFGIYYLDNTRQRICLVSPWMERGNLVEYLKGTPRESVDHLSLVLDVASGLSHLHVKKIVHADLKGVNVLIMPSGGACICDFVRWMAPELLAENASATRESDIYTFACVCYEILTGRVPFYECKSDGAVILQVVLGKHPSRPETLPQSSVLVWDMMEVCWQADPLLRPTASTILHDNIAAMKPADTPTYPALSALLASPHSHIPTIVSPTSTASSGQIPSPTPSSSLLRIDGVSPPHPSPIPTSDTSDLSTTRDDVASPGSHQSNSRGRSDSRRSPAAVRAAQHEPFPLQHPIPPHSPPQLPLHPSPTHNVIVSREDLRLANFAHYSSKPISPPEPSCERDVGTIKDGIDRYQKLTALPETGTALTISRPSGFKLSSIDPVVPSNQPNSYAKSTTRAMPTSSGKSSDSRGYGDGTWPKLPT
ncbi:Rho guanine nucleotide exchange factor [Marasmius sp. AFHP31]|nr:Rho guanine nucleotide exchange factor [Marasmius sp. AFHP31]